MTRKKTTPEELQTKVSDYFAECEALDVFPDRADMIIYLDLPWDTYCRYENNDDGKCAPFAEIFKNARLRREGWLTRVMFSDKNKVQSAIFHLRQPINGGYSDKQETANGINIRLKIGDEDSNLLD